VALFRRRSIWLPTWQGLLLLTIAFALVATLLARHAYALLACDAPLPAARTLVVEGWMDPAELTQVAALLRRGQYQHVLTTGGPLDGWSALVDERSAAGRAAEFLRASEGVNVPVAAVDTPATTRDRTHVSALTLRDRARASGTPLTNFDLITVGAHARRSWLTYRMVFGDEVEIGVRVVAPTRFDGPRWWTSSEGAKKTVDEALSLAWVKCCFWPSD
jgi:hypothetical protein